MQAAVVTFDHLALAFLGCYGNTWIQTPRFDELAAGSVVFDACYGAPAAADAFRGLPALASQLQSTGHFAAIHRCESNAATDAQLRRAIDDWRQATAVGSPALLWLQNPGTESPWSADADQIAAYWQKSFPPQALPEALVACGAEPVESSVPPEAAIARALPQLQSQGWLSRDRRASTPLIGWLRRTIYAAAVATLDRWLGDILDLLDAPGREDTLLIVAAGAGDLTGPHAELSAGCPPLIDPLVHVPLLIRTGSPADGTRRGGLVSTADLAPTLAQWFQFQHAGDDDDPARSLWPLLRDETHAIRDELLIGSPTTGWSLRTLAFACLCEPHSTSDESPEAVADRVRLFVKPDDAWETLNVAQQYPEITADYSRRIRATTLKK